MRRTGVPVSLAQPDFARARARVTRDRSRLCRQIGAVCNWHLAAASICSPDCQSGAGILAEISIKHVARHGFGGLFQAHGRDGRTQFWIFGALVFGPLIFVQFATQIALTFPSLGEMAVAAPGETGMNIKIFEAQMRGMITSAYANIGFYLLGALLMLTAAARRLHDRGRAGWWALILPLGLFSTGLGQAERVADAAQRMPAMLAKMERQTAPDPGAMFDWAVEANVQPDGPDWLAVAGGLLLLGLLIDLARAGTAGPNRFGAAP